MSESDKPSAEQAPAGQVLSSAIEASLERACEQVDTWPDWKLDTLSLSQRNKRRAAGEKLPKPVTCPQCDELGSQLARAYRERDDSINHLSAQLSTTRETLSRTATACAQAINEREDAREIARELAEALEKALDMLPVMYHLADDFQLGRDALAKYKVSK